jgi:hypothetical protein
MNRPVLSSCGSACHPNAIRRFLGVNYSSALNCIDKSCQWVPFSSVPRVLENNHTSKTIKLAARVKALPRAASGEPFLFRLALI